MMLDDKLLLMVKETNLVSPHTIVKLHKSLLNECLEYVKEKFRAVKTDKEAKPVLPRVCNLWDSFVRMLEKTTDTKDVPSLVLLETCKEHTFKKIWFSDPERADVYQKLMKL